MASLTKKTWNKRDARDAKKLSKRHKKVRKAQGNSKIYALFS
jgi:hypothetical protein